MLLETLLPLGKIDPGLRAPELPLDVHSIAADTRLLEEIGYDGLVVEETKDDPFILLSLAAQATRTLKLGTSVAIAFPPQSDRDRDERMDAAKTVPRPLYARPRHAGEGPYRATFRHALDTGRAVDARVC